MSGPLEGRAAVVTGGATWIGLGITRRLLADGARVLVAAQSKEQLESAGLDVPSFIGDLAPAGAGEELLAAAVEALGGVDVLVNNAGGGVIRPTLEHTEETLGHEEVYVVLSGRATFTLGDESLDAPAGTVVFIRDPRVRRHARAEEPATAVLAAWGCASETGASLPPPFDNEQTPAGLFFPAAVAASPVATDASIYVANGNFDQSFSRGTLVQLRLAAFDEAAARPDKRLAASSALVANGTALIDNYAGRMVVNPGSVGLQLNYGVPDARYAVIERHGGRWSASLRAVPFDFEAVAQQVIANGFPKWAEAVRTGWTGADGLFA